jgi:glycosyltransferase involved in cell wall biosynthesis
LDSILSGKLLINLAFLSTKPTGHTVYAKNLLPALNNLNPTLLAGQDFPDFDRYPIPSTLTPDQGGKGHLARLSWTQFQLPRIYDQLGADLIFSPIPEAPIFTKCRYVVTLHDLIPLRFPSKLSLQTPYLKYYMPQVLRQAEHILCDSEATAKDAAQFFEIEAKKMTVIPLAYDEQNFRFLDLPTQNYFLYIGRHNIYKNIQRSLSAFAQLPGDAEFWIAGPPDKRYTPILQAQVEELNLTHRVKFLSYVPYRELPILLNQAIALIFPSLWEGFGLPVLEAMACGTPVVTSNVSSIPEVAGDAALMVDPNNVDAIAQAMREVMESSELRTKLRELGRDRVKQFSWQSTATQTAAILRNYL